MKVSNIKIGHIYNVIFDPVEDCEFDGRHLALVLKKNNDNKTFIVLPLTSASNGVGTNKVLLNTILSLPTSLKCNKTYAVINQIRTVNASRFIALKEGDDVIQSPIDDLVFSDLFVLCIQELTYNLSQDNKIEVLKKLYERECVTKAKNLAYNILKLQKTVNECEEKIIELKYEIKETISNINYSLDDKSIADGIKDIFDDVGKI